MVISFEEGKFSLKNLNKRELRTILVSVEFFKEEYFYKDRDRYYESAKRLRELIISAFSAASTLSSKEKVEEPATYKTEL